MIKQLITEFPLSDAPKEGLSRRRNTKVYLHQREVDILIDAAVERLC